MMLGARIDDAFQSEMAHLLSPRYQGGIQGGERQLSGLESEKGMARVFNRQEQKSLRRRLRDDMPRAEVVLWSRLRGKQLNGLRFRRQYSVGPYVVDFYCPEAKLAIEVDGFGHEEKRDAVRQRFIESYGIAFVRWINDDVYRRIDVVLEEIERVGQERIAQRKAGGSYDGE